MAGSQTRNAPLNLTADEFRELGHDLVEQIAGFLATLPERPVTTGKPPSEIRTLLGQGPLPERGADAGDLLADTARLLFEHSLFNGHPRFWGYITSSAAPIGILGEMLAAAVNPNVGAWTLSPVASEIERQTIQWIAEMVGYPGDCGGVLVSGGNMANFVGFLTALHAKVGWQRQQQKELCLYASKETHTWIHKAVDLFGLDRGAVRWIPADEKLRLRTDVLQQQIEADKQARRQPFLVIGTAGSVSTGAVDPLDELADICQKHDLWFHVDGAYGAFAAVLPENAALFAGMQRADSLALDPHKWLYAPLEAGGALVRDAEKLRATFSYHPPYYKFDQVAGEAVESFVDFGLQNSRGFRALKVWLALKQVGRLGYEQMIRDDIHLAQTLFESIDRHPELEAVTCDLSITTFRFVPADLSLSGDAKAAFLDRLNMNILTHLQEGGRSFVSNALVNGRYVLRACVVNFRTTREDIEALPGIVVQAGMEVLQRQS